VLGITVALLSSPLACKRKKAVLPEDPELEAILKHDGGRPPRAEAPAPPAKKKKTPPPNMFPTGRPVAKVLVRSDKPSLGFPMPEGVRQKKKAMGSELYEAPYTLDSLERFFRREMPRRARIEKRKYGFRVVESEAQGFILVTQVGTGYPQVAVVRPRAPTQRPQPSEGDTPPERGGLPDPRSPGH
jgi:hypothetical protein